jgi:hypothetical protein
MDSIHFPRCPREYCHLRAFVKHEGSALLRTVAANLERPNFPKAVRAKRFCPEHAQRRADGFS